MVKSTLTMRTLSISVIKAAGRRWMDQRYEPAENQTPQLSERTLTEKRPENPRPYSPQRKKYY
ncbi:MAG: hypothetical protein AABX11_00560 [Nanoarchaeota archaeon]